MMQRNHCDRFHCQLLADERLQFLALFLVVAAEDPQRVCFICQFLMKQFETAIRVVRVLADKEAFL